MLETGERVRFKLPSGHFIESSTPRRPTSATASQAMSIPDPWIQGSRERHRPEPHGPLLCCMARTSKVRKSSKVLGFFLVEHVVMEDGKTDLAIWLSCSIKAHDIAFVRHPEPGKLHHVAFKLDSWERVLRAADIMSMNKISIDIGPTRHGITRGTTIYAFDPSGNRFETFCGGYDSYPDYKPVRGPGTKSAQASSNTTASSTGAFHRRFLIGGSKRNGGISPPFCCPERAVRSQRI